MTSLLVINGMEKNMAEIRTGRNETDNTRLRIVRIREKVMRIVFLLTACVSVLAVALICIFLLINGIPAIAEIGIFRFVGGTVWNPSGELYGIFPMILGSIYVTGLAIAIGVPVGILTAVFLAHFCGKRLYKILKPAIDLLAGIPSVVYGFFGLMVIVPIIRNLFGGSGSSMLAAGLVLGIMILPTIIGVTESALKAVPQQYYEGSLALGATHERSVFCAVIPAAGSGILAGVILGIGRAVGETMAVIMVAGNSPVIPTSLFKGLRTLTSNIVMEMGYAQDLHREALIATAVVLFVFILLINLCFSVVKKKAQRV